MGRVVGVGRLGRGEGPGEEAEDGAGTGEGGEGEGAERALVPAMAIGDGFLAGILRLNLGRRCIA